MMEQTRVLHNRSQWSPTKRVAVVPSPDFNDACLEAKRPIHTTAVGTRGVDSRKLFPLNLNQLGIVKETQIFRNKTSEGRDAVSSCPSSATEVFPTASYSDTGNLNEKHMPRRCLKRSSTLFDMHSQVEVKSGILVFISQRDEGNTMSHFEEQSRIDNSAYNKKANSSVARNKRSAYFPSGRSPVMLKVYHTSLGKYAVLASSRGRQGFEQPLCIPLRRSRVTLPQLPKDEGHSESCCFVLTTGSIDGKSYRFEANSREAAMSWATALSSDTTSTTGVTPPISRRSTRVPLCPLVEHTIDEEMNTTEENCSKTSSYTDCVNDHGANNCNNDNRNIENNNSVNNNLYNGNGLRNVNNLNRERKHRCLNIENGLTARNGHRDSTSLRSINNTDTLYDPTSHSIHLISRSPPHASSKLNKNALDTPRSTSFTQLPSVSTCRRHAILPTLSESSSEEDEDI